MRWYVLTFTHYSSDDVLENHPITDYQPLEASSFRDAVREVSAIQGRPVLRIDDGDSPYGGIFCDAAVSSFYHNLPEVADAVLYEDTDRLDQLTRRHGRQDLSDFSQDTLVVYGIFAETVLSDLPAPVA